MTLLFMMISFGLSSCSALVDAVLAQVVRSLRCDLDLLGIRFGDAGLVCFDCRAHRRLR